MHPKIAFTLIALASNTLGSVIIKRDILSDVEALQNSVSYLNCKIGYDLQVANAVIAQSGNAATTCVAPAILVQTVPPVTGFVTLVVTTTLPASTLPGQITTTTATLAGATVTVTSANLPASTISSTVTTTVTATSTISASTCTASTVTSFLTQTSTSTISQAPLPVTQTTTVTSTPNAVTSTKTQTSYSPDPSNPCIGLTAGTISVNYVGTGLGLGSLISGGVQPPGYVTFSSDISQAPMQFTLTAGQSIDGQAFKISITSGGKGGTYLGALDVEGPGNQIGGSGTNYAWLQEMLPGAHETAGTFDQSTPAYGSGAGESFIWKQIAGDNCQLFAVWQNGAANGSPTGSPTNPAFYYDQTTNQIGISDGNSLLMTSSADTTIPIVLTFLPNSV